MNKILLTGTTGFIGKAVARKLLKRKESLTCIVRPQTARNRYEEFIDKIEIVELDLANISDLKSYLNSKKFDKIVHIGALRGGRKFSKKQYFQTNVNATEQLILNALQNASDFIFCSSVGIFGAIPASLPANENTELNPDNYYHYTKIEAEGLVQKYILQGLKAAIVRPAITYGEGDYGFPYTLTKLIQKKLFFLPKTEVKIHLANIETVSEIFSRLVEKGFNIGDIYNAADSEPVNLKELTDFISENLHGKSYPATRSIPLGIFRLFEKIIHRIGNELWIARIELISKSWYYDVENVYDNLKIKRSHTIPDFTKVIEWFTKQEK